MGVNTPIYPVTPATRKGNKFNCDYNEANFHLKGASLALFRKLIQFLNFPERIFAILALGLGIPLCFLLPVGAGFDETAHLTRAIEISYRQLIPNRMLNEQPLVPLVINEVTYRSKNFYTPVSATFFENYKNRKIDWTLVFPKTTYSVYFPILYFPQAAIVYLARRLDWSVLGLYYLCRIAECLGYILLCSLAIRQIPFGKWTLALLALSPTAILQSASISTDPYSNGAAFLFIGWVLYLAFQEGPVTRKQIGLTLLTILLLFSAKVNASALILLLVLLPKNKFPGTRSYILFLASTAALFLVVVITWNGYISLDFRTDRADRGIWKQVTYILADPVQFIRLFVSDIFANGSSYITQWIGVNPNMISPVPPAVYPLYGGFLILTWLTDISKRPIPAKMRWLLAAAFLLSYTFSVVFLYLGGRGPGEGININGRYLTLAAPALFLGLALAKPVPILRKIPAGLPASAGALSAAAAFMVGIYLTFYISCGSSYYIPGLCYLPNYRNLDPTSTFTAPVTSARPVVQEFQAECPEIHSIQVWANPPRVTAGGSTTVSVREVASGQILATTAIPNDQVTFDDWYEIPIPPIENAASRMFTIEITSANPDENSALDFSISAAPEYEAGRLFIQGQEAPHDLYFHYGCKVGK